VSWFALIISLSGLFFLSSKGASWVVGVLVAVEMMQLLLIGVNAVRRWQPGKTVYGK